MADTEFSDLTAVTLPLDGTELLPIVQSGTSKKITALQLGGFATKALTSDASSNSTTTTAKITGLDLATGVGTFIFEYFIRYQAGATTTGVKFDVNHTGTVTHFQWWQSWADVSATAATAAPDQDQILSTGGVQGLFASRAKGTAGRGTTLSVDTANADMMMLIQGFMIVTVSGNLELYHASEVAAASTVKAGTILRLTRAA